MFRMFGKTNALKKKVKKEVDDFVKQTEKNVKEKRFSANKLMRLKQRIDELPESVENNRMKENVAYLKDSYNKLLDDLYFLKDKLDVFDGIYGSYNDNEKKGILNMYSEDLGKLKKEYDELINKYSHIDSAETKYNEGSNYQSLRDKYTKMYENKASYKKKTSNEYESLKSHDSEDNEENIGEVEIEMPEVEMRSLKKEGGSRKKRRKLTKSKNKFRKSKQRSKKR